MAASKTASLISDNGHLASMAEPFSQYYAYYKLSLRFEDHFRKFMEREVEYLKTIYPKTQPHDASVYLVSYQQDSVSKTACECLREFFLKLLKIHETFGDREKITKQFDFGKVDAIKSSDNIGPNNGLSFSRIRDFWYLARRCKYSYKKGGHCEPDFLNLLCAFVGYNNFKDFLNSEFGKDYDVESDTDYKDILQGYVPKEISRKVFKDIPRELSSNSVYPPKIFLGRKIALDNLEKKLNKKQIVRIVAEGGVGKTTLAAAYYHRSIHRRNYRNVAWLFCDMGIMPAIMQMAPLLGLDFRGEKPEDRIILLRNKLHAIQDDFLLVLDNVNDDLFKFLNEFQGFRWHVLVTSRDREDDVRSEIFELMPLDATDAKNLFKEYYRHESGEAFEVLLDQLISAIGRNTLLTEIFSKQLAFDRSSEGDGIYGLKEFLEKLKETGLYLGDSKGNIGVVNYSFYRRTNLATTKDILDILYDFSKLGPLRKTLVNLSLLQAIPHSTLLLFELFPGENKSDLLADLQELYLSGWIGGDGKESYKLSPVVQSLTLEKNKKTLWEDGKELVDSVSFLIKEEPDKDNYRTKFKWLQDAESIANNLEGNTEGGYLEFLNRLGLLLKEIGGHDNLNRALIILNKAFDSDLIKSGTDAHSVARGRASLALVLKSLGGPENLKQAKELMEKTLTSCIKNFGVDDSEVAKSRSNLAVVLRRLGGRDNLKRAKEELEMAISSDMKKYPQDDPGLLLKCSNLGLVLQDLGGIDNLEWARKLLDLVHQFTLKKFGENSPRVAMARSNLGTVLQNLGGLENLHEAAKLFKLALDSDLRNFKPNSVQVAISRSQLGPALLHLGGISNYLWAKEELKLAHKFFLESSGEDGSELSVIRLNYSASLWHLGGFENLFEANSLLSKALSSAILNYGEYHSYTQSIKKLISLVEEDLQNL